ncbi:MAG: hypothetical protein IKZ65_02440, partial [Lachnospiraceae bacterium]|nr:hypothetical protein [Lachnospiraceae bacterium]
MDRYEYRTKMEQIDKAKEIGDYQAAGRIAETIDWSRVKRVAVLCDIADLYDRIGRYEECKEMLLMAYERSPIGRMIVYRLCDVSIKLKDINEAKTYFDLFLQLAPSDPHKYILQYKIEKASGAPIDRLINILENLKSREFMENWAYELAYLYHKKGMITQCVEECNDIFLWFGEGKYVEKALELKLLHQPLTPLQMERYEYMRAKRISEAKRANRGKNAADFEPRVPSEDEMDIAPVEVKVQVYDTINLQKELAKNLDQIMNATGNADVTKSLDNVKELVNKSNIPELKIEEPQPLPEPEEEVSTLDDTFNKFLSEELDGQISFNVPEQQVPEKQITGQLSIEDIGGLLAEWDMMKRAADKAYEVEAGRRFESDKERAIAQTKGIITKLDEVMPRYQEANVKAKADAEAAGRRRLETEEAMRAKEEAIKGNPGVAIPKVVPIPVPTPVPTPVVTPAPTPTPTPVVTPAAAPVASAVPTAAHAISTAAEEAAEQAKRQAEVASLLSGATTVQPVEAVRAAVEEVLSNPAEEVKEPAAEAPVVQAVPEVPKAPVEVKAEPVMTGGDTKRVDILTDRRLAEIEARKQAEIEERERVMREAEEARRAELAEMERIEEETRRRIREEAEAKRLAALEATRAAETESEALKARVAEEEARLEGALKGMTGEVPAMPVTPVTSVTEAPAAPEVEPQPVAPVTETPAAPVKPEPVVAKNEPEPAVAENEPEPVAAQKPAEEPIEYKPEELSWAASQNAEVADAMKAADQALRVTVESNTAKLPPITMTDYVLSPDQKDEFSYFMTVKGVEDQICKTLCNMKNAYARGDLSKSNIIISGAPGMGKTKLAMSLVKVIQQMGIKESGRFGKISSEKLNEKPAAEVFAMLEGGCVVIEKAASLTKEKTLEIKQLMERNSYDVTVILEDAPAGLGKLLGSSFEFAEMFTNHVSIPI